MFAKIEAQIEQLLQHASRVVDAAEEIARNTRDIARETGRLADAVSNLERKGS